MYVNVLTRNLSLITIFSIFYMVGKQKVCIQLNKIRNSQKAMPELQILHHPECIKKGRGGKYPNFCFFS